MEIKESTINKSTDANKTRKVENLTGLPVWFTSTHANYSWLTDLKKTGLEDVCFQCPKSCNQCDTDGCTEYK